MENILGNTSYKEKTHYIINLCQPGISIHSPIYKNNNDQTKTLADILLTIQEDITKNIYQNEIKTIIRETITKLTPKEQAIIRHHYGINEEKQKSLTEISKNMNLSVERIRQIKEQAMRKLKTELKKRLNTPKSKPTHKSKH